MHYQIYKYKVKDDILISTSNKMLSHEPFSFFVFIHLHKYIIWFYSWPMLFKVALMYIFRCLKKVVHLAKFPISVGSLILTV